MKTNKEIIDEYTAKYGGFPYFLFICIDDSEGACDPEIVNMVQMAIEGGYEITAESVHCSIPHEGKILF